MRGSEGWNRDTDTTSGTGMIIRARIVSSEDKSCTFTHCYQHQNKNAREITVQVTIIVDSTENTE
jgi:hypothetical protein